MDYNAYMTAEDEVMAYIQSLLHGKGASFGSLDDIAQAHPELRRVIGEKVAELARTAKTHFSQPTASTASSMYQAADDIATTISPMSGTDFEERLSDLKKHKMGGNGGRKPTRQ